MKRVVGIIFVLILAIALGLAADTLREGGVSMVSAYYIDGDVDDNGSLPHRSDSLGREVSRDD